MSGSLILGRAPADTIRRVFRRLLDDGVYSLPSQFESALLSVAHGAAELALTVAAFGRALRADARKRNGT